MSEHPEPYGGFLQFPLCLLAQSGDFWATLVRTSAYAVVSFLNKTEGSNSWQSTPDSREDALSKARKVIVFKLGDIDEMIKGHNAANKFLSEWKSKGRKTCEVRLRTDIMISFFAGHITEREFRILCGLFSGIGAKPYAKLGWLSIQCRAAGWLSTPAATEGVALYPRGQIERTLTELQIRNLVRCVTYKRGERYWSHSLSREELEQAVKKRKLRRDQFLSERAARNDRLSAEIDKALPRTRSEDSSKVIQLPQSPINVSALINVSDCPTSTLRTGDGHGTGHVCGHGTGHVK